MFEMSRILIEVKPDDSSVISDLEKHDDFTVITSDRFDGDSIVQLLVTLSTISIPLAAKMIVENIKSNKHVIVKKDGVIVKGLNADDTIKILKELEKDD